MSHLYGFHPGNMVTKEKNPDLLEAVKKHWISDWLMVAQARVGAGPG
ncbi:MAG: hypothetical protein IPK94_08215 [Saprospiraceae bacterium]|nr:hypothetical protein [Saprospiraceae bacterium]